MADLSLVFDILAKDRASAEFNKVGDAADSAGKRGAAFGTAIAAGALVAVGALVKFGKDSVDAFVESEQASVRLDEALKKFPATNDVTRASFDRLNESLAAKTRFDDDATASGQAVLAQFGLTGAEILKLTPLLQDYAAKTGQDIPTAAESLGKAVLGQGRALKEVGIDFTDTGTKAGNLDAIMGGLRTQVGGFAEAEGQTAAGQAAILGNRFGEVQEKVGEKLTPALTTLAEKLIEVIDFTEKNSAVVVPLVAVLGTLTVGVLAVNAAMTAGTAVTTAYAAVKGIFTTTTVAETGATTASTISRIAHTVATTAGSIAAGIATVATVALTAATTALGVAINFALGPIGLTIIALAAIAIGLKLAWDNSETFRDIVTGAFTKVLAGVDALLAGVQFLFEALANVPGFGWADTAANAVKGARDQVRGLAADINNLPTTKTVTVNYQQVGSITNVPYRARAAGGPISANQPYLVGERGPEMVMPSRSGFVLTAAQTAGLGGGDSSAEVRALRGDVQNLVRSFTQAQRQGAV